MAWTFIETEEEKCISAFTLPLLCQCPYDLDACQFGIFAMPREQQNQL